MWRKFDPGVKIHIARLDINAALGDNAQASPLGIAGAENFLQNCLSPGVSRGRHRPFVGIGDMNVAITELGQNGFDA